MIGSVLEILEAAQCSSLVYLGIFFSFHTYHPKRNWVVLGQIQLFNIWKPRLFQRSLCESRNYRLKRAYLSSKMTLVRDHTLYFSKLMEK